MYKLTLHKTLTQDKWEKFNPSNQLLMISNEINRAINWIKKKDWDEVDNCYERAFELLDITISVTGRKNKLKELLRLREVLSSQYISKRKDLNINKQLLKALILLDKDSYNLLNCD